VPKLGDGVLLCCSFYCCVACCAAAFFLHEVFFPWHWHLLCLGIGDCIASCHGIGDCVPWHWLLHFASCHSIATFWSAATPMTLRMYLFSPESSATDAPFCRFLYFIFDTSRCHFPECRNTHDFLEVPFSSLESRAAHAPFWKSLFLIALQCNFPEHRNTRHFPEVPFSSPESGATMAMFFCTGSMRVAAQCLQVDCVFGKATGHLFDL